MSYKAILREDKIKDNGIYLRYCLFGDEDNEESGYAIRIEMQIPNGSFFSSEETLFYSKEGASKIFELLLRNKATPSNLKYVLLDLEENSLQS